MTVTVDSFRSNYPEFSDSERIPNSAINYYLNYAGLLLSQTSRWGNLQDLGTELFIAHNVVLEARAQAEADAGGIPGVTTGPIQIKQVSKVQIQYEVQFGIELDAGHWTNTIYGTRFIRLARMIGSGPIQIGIGGCGFPNGQNDGGFWSGPDCSPGFTNFS